MPVRVSDGWRSVVSEIEIPGDPDEVWDLIAEGPGISSWFVPTRSVRSDEGGNPTQVICEFGPGMEAVAEIKSWDPPRSFTAEAPWGPDMPVATEWHVEAQQGGTCVVRVVHRLFSSDENWDNQLESTETGWASYFRVLVLRQAAFRGQPGTVAHAMATAEGTVDAVWANWRREAAIGEVGADWSATWGASYQGTVHEVGAHEAFVRLSGPAPGIAHLSVHPMGDQAMRIVRVFHYGVGAPTADAQALNAALEG